MFEKLKVEKVELVKRVIRQNNYDQYEKTFRQCSELGLNINRQALDRFANKLELIDKAQLSKRQYELQKLEIAKQEQQEDREKARNAERSRQLKIQKKQQQQNRQISSESQRLKDIELDAHLDSMDESLDPMLDDAIEEAPRIEQRSRDRRSTDKPRSRQPSTKKVELSYEEVKQRETEITFELGELKIRENELL
eukprot:CAMPEP_0184473774 /NCGR_PEP_ID=MMETSP0740-20130409/127290_1 /TAXON_ID=385413 /ORGANISM="Thalassiosira miniscula, Strain CCMP1093" /LENGTH=194 /DNA_ID=CAMNT_0026850813 /DNA_START=57 /DNA_END=638 /DNA_ORIENTATION=-